MTRLDTLDGHPGDMKYSGVALSQGSALAVCQSEAQQVTMRTQLNAVVLLDCAKTVERLNQLAEIGEKLNARRFLNPEIAQADHLGEVPVEDAYAITVVDVMIFMLLNGFVDARFSMAQIFAQLPDESLAEIPKTLRDIGKIPEAHQKNVRASVLDILRRVGELRGFNGSVFSL